MKNTYRTALSLTTQLCALLKLGQNASMIRGSIGGITYANNRAGAYARNRSVPVNPRTPSQTSARTIFGSLSAAWSALTSDQQMAWNNAAALVTRVNRVGESYTPTGRQLYLELNGFLAHWGQATNSAPPSDFTPPEFPAGMTGTAKVVAGAITVLKLDWPVELVGDDCLLIEAAPMSVSKRTNYQRYFRQVVASGTSILTFNFTTEYTALFGTSGNVGQQLALRIRCCDQATGLTSAALIMFVDVVAGP